MIDPTADGSGAVRNVLLVVSFNTQDWRDSCASFELAEAKIGSEHAHELLTLLSDAEAADTAADLIDLYAPMVAVDADTISVAIGTRYRVALVAIGSTVVRRDDAGIDWSTVRRLKLMDLCPC